MRPLASMCARSAAASVAGTAFDVVVYGSTPGGIMAAIAAANTSLNVALVSPSAHVGGMTAGGLGQTDIGNASCVMGLANTFFETVGALYSKQGPVYQYEPHVAEAAFLRLLDAQPTLTLFTSQTLVAVSKTGAVISSISTGPTDVAESSDDAFFALAGGNATVFTASIFIDASYEGDLLAMAGVPYATGREGAAQYNESLGGRLFVPNSIGGHQVSPHHDAMLQGGGA